MGSIQTYNLFEAILWFVMSLLLLISALYEKDGTPKQKKVLMVMSIAFAVLGLSDFVEMRTGTWSSPVWLFLMKVGSFIAIGTCTSLLYAHEEETQDDIKEVKQRAAQRKTSSEEGEQAVTPDMIEQALKRPSIYGSKEKEASPELNEDTPAIEPEDDATKKDDDEFL